MTASEPAELAATAGRMRDDAELIDLLRGMFSSLADEADRRFAALATTRRVAAEELDEMARERAS